MQRITSPDGVKVSYEKYGAGPCLVLVHGAFSDHRTNWEFVKPLFENQFTVHAIARRGRGETDATRNHSLEDESRDVVSVIRAIGEPVFLLGHSYGAPPPWPPQPTFPTAFASSSCTRRPGPGSSQRRCWHSSRRSGRPVSGTNWR
jgi:pimeloyl-ACP methyl ester carboxylesterase